MLNKDKENVVQEEDDDFVLEIEDDLESTDDKEKDKEFKDLANKFESDKDKDKDKDVEDEDEDNEEKPRKIPRSEKRIRGLVAKTKQYESDLAAAVQYIKSVEQELQEARTRTKTSESAYVEEADDRLKAQLERARADFISAKQNDDEEALLRAQEQIAEVKVEQRNLANLKVKLKTDKDVDAAAEEKNKSKQQVVKQQPKLSPKAAQWAKRNSEWFVPVGADPTYENKKRTNVAMLIHESLLEEGYDPADPDDRHFGEDSYYKELDKRIKKEFNVTEEDDDVEEDDDTENESRSQKKQIVAGGSHTPGSGTKKKNTVKLSRTEVEQAKRLGVDPKRYAEEKIKIAKRGGA